MIDDGAMVIAVSMVVALFIGLQIFAVINSGRLAEGMDKSQEWCENHNGTLANSNVIGEHGGLHCELPNGTSVHMHEVINTEEQT